jgi:hypothetical protein
MVIWFVVDVVAFLCASVTQRDVTCAESIIQHANLLSNDSCKNVNKSKMVTEKTPLFQKDGDGKVRIIS